MVQDRIPNELECDLLFLLVGSNPLPNWVAAKLLLRGDGALYLVHSETTKKVAERISNFARNCGCKWQVTLVKVYDEHDAVSVYQTVQERMKGISTGRVGLNFTGGTKVMAVHSYRAARDWEQRNNQSVVFSYLDAADFLMRFEVTPDYPKGHQQTVGLAVPLTLEEILSLHETVNLKEPIKRDTRGQSISPLLMQLYRDSDGQKCWRGYCESMLKYGRISPPPRGSKKRVGDLKEEAELAGEKLNPRTSDRSVVTPLKNVTEALIPGGSSGTKTLKEVMTHHPEFTTVTELAEWMDGFWLEEYALDQILSLQQAYRAADEAAKLYDCGRNLRINRPMNIEADVAVMRGYQLHLISCYSGSETKTARLKLFEVFTHARNLGGEAARAALISCVSDPAYIKEQVGQLLGDDRQVEVFGRDDLKDLKLKLKRWFDSGARSQSTNTNNRRSE